MGIIPNRLADMLARKQRGRRSLAVRPVAEKLAILDEMRASLEPLRQARKARRKRIAAPVRQAAF